MSNKTTIILCPYCSFPVVTDHNMDYCLCLACHCRLTTTPNNKLKYAILYHEEDDCQFQLIFKNNKTFISVKYKLLPNELFDNILILDFFLEQPVATAMFNRIKEKIKKLVVFS